MKPLRPDCMPDNLFNKLVDNLQDYSRHGHHTQTRALPWLTNRTVVLIGDPIDRYVQLIDRTFLSASAPQSHFTPHHHRFHLRDFCDLLLAAIEPPFHSVSDIGRSPSASTPDSPSQSFHIDPQSPLSTDPYFYNLRNHAQAPPDWPSEHRASFAQKQKEWSTRR